MTNKKNTNNADTTPTDTNQLKEEKKAAKKPKKEAKTTKKTTQPPKEQKQSKNNTKYDNDKTSQEVSYTEVTIQADQFDDEYDRKAQEAAFEGDDFFDDDDDKEERANDVIRAVESIIDTNAKIRAVSEDAIKRAAYINTEHERLQYAANYIVDYYSNRAGLAGGISSLPGFIPGIGTIMSLFGGTLIDVILTLKFEVEMALCLCDLFGYNIEEDRERKIAFLLASVAVHDAYATKTKFSTALKVADIALWEYSTRQLSAMMIKLVGHVILMVTSKRLLKIFPFVGVFIGFSVNKVLTKQAGRKNIAALFERKKQQEKGQNNA